MIDRHERKSVLKGLSDEEPVERVAVEGGQASQMGHCPFIDGQTGDGVRLSHQWEMPVRLIREWEFPEGVFDDGFPNRHDAQVDIVARIADRVAVMSRELRIAGVESQEDLGVNSNVIALRTP